MTKPNMSMTNRFNEKEKLLKQFEKKTVSIEETLNTEKAFEVAIKGCTGPTVILINGAAEPLEGWMKIWPLFDASMTVFAYNRSCIENSGELKEPQNAVNRVDDLRKLLKAVALQPPYVLVGHALGGFIAHVFASNYPQEISGIVFLEASTIEDETLHLKAIKGNPFDEINCVGASITQINALTSFPKIPITVIAGFHPISRMWLPKGRFFKCFEHQKKLLELSVQSSLIVATKSGYFPQMSEPRLVTEAIYVMSGR